MGLREAILSSVVILGLTVVADADPRSSKGHPAKPAKDPAAGDARPAERPDPAAPADSGTDAATPGAEVDQVPPHIVGPKHVELGNSASIDLPEGMVLFERAVAADILRKGGESAEGLVGIVFKPGSSWVTHIDYADSGYIDDSDASELDADELLQSYREGTEEQNKTRRSLGTSELVIDKWSEPPRYERASHHLVWGIAAHSVEGKVINFFTRILGRNGYLSVTLIDGPDTLEASKQEALAVLRATHFNAGGNYTDHVSSDRSSGIGLRGLVLGGAGIAVASKIGVLAKILLVFKKGIILLVAGVGGLFRWLFRRKPKADPLAGLGYDLSQGPPPGTPPPSSGMPPQGGPPDGSSSI